MKTQTNSCTASYTTDKLQEALRPIASLMSKSEKARQKLAPETWQHTMLRNNLEALNMASALMNKQTNDAVSFTQDELQKSLHAFTSMIKKTGKSRDLISPNTSSYTLLQNRLTALRIAKALITTALKSQ